MTLFTTTDRDYKLWWVIVQARTAMVRAREKELKQYQLTTREAAVMYIIQAIGGRATTTDISRYSLRKPHAVTDLLKRMEKKGLIINTQEKIKRNICNVSLTEKGEKAYRQSAKRESIHTIMSSLTEIESKRLESYMNKLHNKALELWAHERTLPFS